MRSLFTVIVAVAYLAVAQARELAPPDAGAIETALIWARGMTGSGRGHGCEIEVTSDGRAIVSGDVMGELTFGFAAIRSKGLRDTFVACFDHDGRLDWVKPIRAQATAANFAIALDPTRPITVVGSYAGRLECDGEQLSSTARMASFIITRKQMPSQPKATSR